MIIEPKGEPPKLSHKNTWIKENMSKLKKLKENSNTQMNEVKKTMKDMK
jgi:hypothetical protein